MRVRAYGPIPASGPENVTEFEQALAEPGASPEVLRRALITDQIWWKLCRNAIARDHDWLYGTAARMRDWINDHGPTTRPDAVPEADTPYVVARALALGFGPGEEESTGLARLARRWHGSGLLLTRTPPGAGLLSADSLATVDHDTRRRVDNVLAGLRASSDDGQSNDAARTMVALTAAMLSGLEPSKGPGVQVSVVFGGTDTDINGGASGTIELREYAAGPEGLFPDPRTMAGTHAGPAFAESLTHAWEATPWPGQGRCVLWRLVMSDNEHLPPAIDGGSLGAAFAIGLRELFRQNHTRRRPVVNRMKTTFHGLRPRTAVTGVMHGTDHLGRVAAMGDKLRTTQRRGWRLVAPEANRHNGNEAADPKTVKFAETLTEADRYARQWRVGRLATALTVIVASVTTGFVIYQRDAASSERIQLASKLADVSGSLLGTDNDLAQLFAVRAYQENPGPQTRAALFRSVTTNPHLVRTFQADGNITATSSSGDGQSVLTGTKQGTVQRWRPRDNTHHQASPILRRPGEIRDLATNQDGTVVTAVDDTGVSIIAPGSAPTAVAVDSGQRPMAVGVSPSGRYIGVSVWNAGVTGSTLYLLDRTSGGVSSQTLPTFSIPPDAIVFPDDGHVVLFDGSYGIWERRTLPSFERTAGSGLGFGTHDYGSAMSADGRFFSYTNGADSLPIWPTEGTPSIDAPPRTAQVQQGSPVGLAMNGDGSRIAYTTSSTIYVAHPADQPKIPAAPVVLGGFSPITTNTVAFLGGTGNRLLAAAGDKLAIWDVNQISRIAEMIYAKIPSSCNACTGPSVAAQPGGPGVAVVDGNFTSLDVQRFGSKRDTRQSRNAGLISPPTYAPPLWTPDGGRIIQLSSADNSAEILLPTRGLPVSGSWPAAPNPLGLSDAVSLVQLTSDGRRVLEVHGSGALEVRNIATGEVVRHLDGPRSMAPTADGYSTLPQSAVTADPTASHVAVIGPTTDAIDSGITVYVTNVADGTVHSIDGAGVTGIAYADDRLLVQRNSGSLELWTSDGTERADTIQGVPGTIVGPVTNGTTLVAEVSEVSNTDTVQLLDYPSGYPLGTLTPPQGDKPSSIGLAFSPGGRRLITATEGLGLDEQTTDAGQVVNWQTNPDAWTQIACASAGHDLTAAQWVQYTGNPPPGDLSCLGHR